jgi:hypothetical protein
MGVMEVITWLLGGGKAAAMVIVASDHQNHVWRILPGHVPSVALPIHTCPRGRSRGQFFHVGKKTV